MKTVWIDRETGHIGIFEKWRCPIRFKTPEGIQKSIGYFEIGWKSGPIVRLTSNWKYIGRF